MSLFFYSKIPLLPHIHPRDTNPVQPEYDPDKSMRTKTVRSRVKIMVERLIVLSTRDVISKGYKIVGFEPSDLVWSSNDRTEDRYIKLV